MNQTKLSAGNLLNENGQLAEAGYAQALIRQYNRAAIKAPRYKIKEWDYYLVYNQDFGIALTVADNSYMGLVSASFLDFKTNKERTFSPMIPLTFGRLRLPASSESGNIVVVRPQYEVSFTHEGQNRRLKLIMAGFDQGEPLTVDILLTDQPEDSMVIATPFGFNLGYGFGDTRAATENMLFYEGKAHKLEGVHFEIQKTSEQTEDYLKPWQFTSTDGRFEAAFKPILDRAAYTSLGILLSDQHQVFGYFDGKAVLDDGTIVTFEHFLGFAEKVRNKW